MHESHQDATFATCTAGHSKSGCAEGEMQPRAVLYLAQAPTDKSCKLPGTAAGVTGGDAVAVGVPVAVLTGLALALGLLIAGLAVAAGV